MKLKKILHSKYFFILNLAFIVFVGFFFARAFLRHRQIEGEIAELRRSAEEFSARNFDILELGSLMQTESFIEREARLKLGKKKPGESVVVIQHGAEVAELEHPLETLADTQDDPAQFSNPAKWRMAFFNTERFGKLSSYVKR